MAVSIDICSDSMITLHLGSVQDAVRLGELIILSARKLIAKQVEECERTLKAHPPERVGEGLVREGVVIHDDMPYGF